MSFVKLPVLRHGLMLRHEEILPDAMVAWRIDAVRKLMERYNVKSLMVYSDAATNGPVCYLTNYPCFGLNRSAVAVLGSEEGPFLFTSEPSRNLPRVRRFTTCDPERKRRLVAEACERAKTLAAGSAIGLGGVAHLSVGLAKDLEAELAGTESKDISRDFCSLLAAKDESSFQATRYALGLAEEGVTLLTQQMHFEKDLWQLAAYMDYRLRLLKCEDTNILLGCAARGPVRPGYPPRIRPQPGNVVVAYVAVQYARHWGAVGRTLSVGPANDDLKERLLTLGEVQHRLPSKIRMGMTLGEVEANILAIGAEKGVILVQDFPLVTGVGFDLSEFPARSEDRVETNAVLQVVLAVDCDVASTVMLVNMLQVTGNGGVWLSKGSSLLEV
jgi:Xaa-Pro aminopeptidase